MLMLSYKRHENSKRVCIRSQILGNLKIIKSLFTSSTKQVFLADYIGHIDRAYLSSVLLSKIGGQVEALVENSGKNMEVLFGSF